MGIHGCIGCSLVDCPGKIASVFFLGDCNLRCPFCHNPALVLDPESLKQISYVQYCEFLRERRGLLDVVVFSGGEPTLDRSLPGLLQTARDFGFATKVDTNGTLPDQLEKLIPLVDYVGLDFKTTPERYEELGPPQNAGEKWLKSLDMLRESKVDLEVRTTVHPEIQTPEDLHAMGDILREKGIGLWYWQQFHKVETLAIGFDEIPGYTDQELLDMLVDVGGDEIRIKVRGLK